MFQCTCCKHVGPCQPHSKSSALASLAEVHVHPGWGAQQEITVGARVKVKLGKECQEWKVKQVDHMVQIQRKDRTLEVEQRWFFYDTESMSFRLQQMGFFYGSYRKRLTPFQQWRDLLNPDEMMMDEVLYILLAWTTYGHSKQLGLPAALSKIWLADTDFWGY